MKRLLTLPGSDRYLEAAEQQLRQIIYRPYREAVVRHLSSAISLGDYQTIGGQRLVFEKIHRIVICYRKREALRASREANHERVTAA